MVTFCPIASGSSGNCIFAGTESTRLLIDAGLSGRTIEKGLAGICDRPIDGILLTHEHSDHISGAGVLARRFHVPVYATKNTWRYLLRHKTIGAVPESQIKMVEPGQTFSMGDMEITAFDVPHDSSQPVGYCLQSQGYKITVATDMGCVTDTIREYIRGSHILLLESNHDLEMLKNSRYPRQLIERVMSSQGHLSNVSAGTLLAETAWEGLQFVFLGHLSEENNRPLVALDTVRNILESRRVHIKNLTIADRYGPGEPVVLR